MSEAVYEVLGGFIISVSDTGVEQTGLTAGALYEFVAHGAHVLCRWDTTTAVVGDGGFTFAVAPGAPMRVRCPTANTLLNVIEANADSAGGATLTLSVVEEGA